MSEKLAACASIREDPEHLMEMGTNATTLALAHEQDLQVQSHRELWHRLRRGQVCYKLSVSTFLISFLLMIFFGCFFMKEVYTKRVGPLQEVFITIHTGVVPMVREVCALLKQEEPKAVLDMVTTLHDRIVKPGFLGYATWLAIPTILALPSYLFYLLGTSLTFGIFTVSAKKTAFSEKGAFANRMNKTGNGCGIIGMVCIMLISFIFAGAFGWLAFDAENAIDTALASSFRDQQDWNSRAKIRSNMHSIGAIVDPNANKKDVFAELKKLFEVQSSPATRLLTGIGVEGNATTPLTRGNEAEQVLKAWGFVNGSDDLASMLAVAEKNPDMTNDELADEWKRQGAAPHIVDTMAKSKATMNMMKNDPGALLLAMPVFVANAKTNGWINDDGNWTGPEGAAAFDQVMPIWDQSVHQAKQILERSFNGQSITEFIEQVVHLITVLLFESWAIFRILFAVSLGIFVLTFFGIAFSSAIKTSMEKYYITQVGRRPMTDACNDTEASVATDHLNADGLDADACSKPTHEGIQEDSEVICVASCWVDAKAEP